MNLEKTTPAAQPPVTDPPTEAKQPASPPAAPHTAPHLLAHQQPSKEATQQARKPASQKTRFPASMPARILPHQQTTKAKKKYGTYLREDSIEHIQICAIQTKRKDHEVLQEAIDRYFSVQKK